MSLCSKDKSVMSYSGTADPSQSHHPTVSSCTMSLCCKYSTVLLYYGTADPSQCNHPTGFGHRTLRATQSYCKGAITWEQSIAVGNNSPAWPQRDTEMSTVAILHCICIRPCSRHAHLAQKCFLLLALKSPCAPSVATLGAGQDEDFHGEVFLQ